MSGAPAEAVIAWEIPASYGWAASYDDVDLEKPAQSGSPRGETPQEHPPSFHHDAHTLIHCHQAGQHPQFPGRTLWYRADQVYIVTTLHGRELG